MILDDSKRPYLTSGTTTIGIISKNGIVMGTDRRATAGYFVAHKHAKKVFKIDNHIAATIAGRVADAQALIDIIKAEAALYKITRGAPISVQACARLMSNVLFQSRIMPYVMQSIIGGVDESGPQLFTVDPLGSLIAEKYCATGSGSPIAYGILEDAYSEDLSVEEAIPVVCRAIFSAIERDIGSGNGFDIVIIDKDGYRKLPDTKVNNILKQVMQKRRSRST